MTINDINMQMAAASTQKPVVTLITMYDRNTIAIGPTIKYVVTLRDVALGLFQNLLTVSRQISSVHTSLTILRANSMDRKRSSRCEAGR